MTERCNDHSEKALAEQFLQSHPGVVVSRAIANVFKKHRLEGHFTISDEVLPPSPTMERIKRQAQKK